MERGILFQSESRFFVCFIMCQIPFLSSILHYDGLLLLLFTLERWC